MKIKLLAFDSMGTRSMCSVIETKNAKILIDPSAALGPHRYGLKPHPLEREKLKEHKELIREEAENADLIIITHYHYDHFPRPSEEINWLRGKRILLKDPINMINFSQKMRAKIFLARLRKIGAKPEIADSKEMRIQGCKISFSPPVNHGNDSKLGFVLEVLVMEGGEKVVHSSDVEGFVNEDQLKFVLRHKPDVLICDGPMTYMLGSRFSEEDLEKSLANLIKIVKKGFLSDLIIDHHAARDLEWRSRISPLLREGDGAGVRVISAAGYMGMKEELLEARRKELYEKFKEEAGGEVSKRSLSSGSTRGNGLRRHVAPR